MRYDETAGDRRHWLSRPRSLAWVVHPCADEDGLLAELGMTADACRSVDAYCRYGDNVYFVQVLSAKAHSDPPCIRYRFDTAYRQDQFVVLLPSHPIRTQDLIQVLECLEGWVDRGVVTKIRQSLRPGTGRWLDAEPPLQML